MTGPVTSGAFPPVTQRYLFEARQMQALSFSVHIPLVCFGIALPSLVLVHRVASLRAPATGFTTDYRAAAGRVRVMVTLFAVGVITGTVLSFEMGLLWPNFTGTFGGVFGLGFAVEGFSFFMEAIFIGIYVYGWDRLSRRAHMLSCLPIVISGVTGSLMVIAVNAWMNHPGGFRLDHGKVIDVDPFKALFENSYLWHELVHMYVAGFVVTGFLLAGVYAFARLRGRWTRYERMACAIPLAAAAVASIAEGPIGDWAARDVATTQPVKLAAMEGLYRTTHGAPEHLLGWYSGGRIKFGIEIPHLLSVLAFHSWNAGVPGLASVPPADRPPVNVTRVAFQSMVRHGDAAGSGLSVVPRRLDPLPTAAAGAVVLLGRCGGRPAVGGRTNRRVGRDRGRSPAMLSTA